MMTLREMMEKQAEFDANHKGSQQWGQKITAKTPDVLEHSIVCLTGELGELANIVKKVHRGDRSFEAAREDIVEEVTDVFIYLLQLANQLDVDLEESFQWKLARNW